MKRFFLLTLIALPLTHAMAQDDDLYFTPDLEGKVETVRRVRSPRISANDEVSVYENSKYAVYNSNSRDEDEYNRRFSFNPSAGEDGVDYSLDYESNDTVFNTDSTSIDQTDDYAYSRRILRFHSPRAAVALSSPYYWDLVYDYGIYDYMYDAYYDPFFYSWGWRYGWSWGPWSCWYGGLWGWNYPYHWSYWGWGPGWHHSYWHGHRWNHGHFSHRGGGVGNFRNRFDRGNGIRTNHLANGGNASRSTGTFGGRGTGIASRGNLTARSMRGEGGRPTRGSLRSYNNLQGRSSYNDYSRSRSVNTPDTRVNGTMGRNRYSYDRPSSSRGYTNSGRTNYESGRSTYAPSRSTYSGRSSNSSYTPSRSSYSPSSSSFGGGRSSFGGGGGRSSFGGGHSGGFGGGSRGGGFGGGGGRGGGRR